VVPDNQLSLAIGKEGLNARLAARLTGFKIDIKSETQAKDTPGFRLEDYYDEEEYEEGEYEEGEYIEGEYEEGEYAEEYEEGEYVEEETEEPVEEAEETADEEG
jgi:N utilization substance protein A